MHTTVVLNIEFKPPACPLGEGDPRGSVDVCARMSLSVFGSWQRGHYYGKRWLFHLPRGYEFR